MKAKKEQKKRTTDEQDTSFRSDVSFVAVVSKHELNLLPRYDVSALYQVFYTDVHHSFIRKLAKRTYKYNII